MSKVTPGPWEMNTRGRRVTARAPDGSVFDVANIVAIDGRDVPGTQHERAEMRKANARLIAAAQDLLEACRRLLQFNEELCEDVNVSKHYPSADFARAAIAKATGEQP